MTNPFKKQRWYMKSRLSSSNIQGPFSTKQIVQYIKDPSLKERVCVSPDGQEWHTFSSLFPSRPILEETIQEVLGELLKKEDEEEDLLMDGANNLLLDDDADSEQIIFNLSKEYSMTSSKKSGKIPKEVYFGIYMGVLVSVILAVIWLKHPKNTEQEVIPDTNQTSPELPQEGTKSPDVQPTETTKYPQKEKKNPPADRPDYSKPVPDPGEMNKPEESSPKEKPAKKTEDFFPEPEKKKPEIKPEEKEAEKTLESKKQEEKPALKKKTKEELKTELLAYYAFLSQIAEESAKKYSVKEAYVFFGERFKNLNVFLEERGNVEIDPGVIEKIRFESKDARRHAFFYPAAMYNDYKMFLASLEKPRMAQLEKRIEEQKTLLSSDLRGKEKLEKERVDFKVKHSQLEAEYNTAVREISDNKRTIETQKDEIQRLRESISRYREEERGHQSKIRQLSQAIRELQRKIRYEKDPKKKEELEKRMENAERERDDYLAKTESVQKKIDSSERKIDRATHEAEKRAGEVSEWEKKSGELKEELAQVKGRQDQIVRELDQNIDRLKPLEELQRYNRELVQTYDKVQKWWATSNPKPRANFLLALYVLQEFQANYYYVKVKEWMADGGIVEVQYW